MSFDVIKSIERMVHEFLGDLDAEIQPGIAYLKANVPAAAIKIGESVLAGAAVGTPWAALLSALIAQAETQGVTLAEGAANVVLNYAQSNLIAKGTITATKPAAIAPAV